MWHHGQKKGYPIVAPYKTLTLRFGAGRTLETSIFQPPYMCQNFRVSNTYRSLGAYSIGFFVLKVICFTG